MERTSQQKGKLAEFLVFGELIKRGAELYLPVIDTGIDAIVHRKDGKYLDIQVKTTEKGWSFAVWDLDRLRPGERFFIVCVDMSKQDFIEKPEVWIFPSEVFKEYANEIRSKEGYKLYRLDLDSKSKKHDNKPRRVLLQKHRDAWELLTGDTTQGVD